MNMRYFIVTFTVIASLLSVGQAYSHTVIHEPKPVIAAIYETASLMNEQPNGKIYRVAGDAIQALPGSSQSSTDLSSSPMNNAQKWWNYAKNIYMKGEMIFSIIGKFMRIIISYVDSELKL
ncbi:hypothetical protein [Bartonella sp. A05]|uniref:hypothetical protein n=1 Tax=Bartonella sp. A05 TaxID=2967261 RepID=UPI0022A986F7|nr:hypothetical protein [Bartonella sp. A05]MCZ2203695.1 hypothetical protein [Bartonella sp. A05]